MDRPIMSHGYGIFNPVSEKARIYHRPDDAGDRQFKWKRKDRRQERIEDLSVEEQKSNILDLQA